MRRSDQPSRPARELAAVWLSPRTLLMAAREHAFLAGVNVSAGSVGACFQVSISAWFWVSTEDARKHYRLGNAAVRARAARGAPWSIARDSSAGCRPDAVLVMNVCCRQQTDAPTSSPSRVSALARRPSQHWMIRRARQHITRTPNLPAFPERRLLPCRQTGVRGMTPSRTRLGHRDPRSGARSPVLRVQSSRDPCCTG